MGGGTDSQINESAADETGDGAGGQRRPPHDLQGQVREYVEGSLARYDQVKDAAAVFRKQGWYPSFFLRTPEADVLVEPGADGTKTVTAHVSVARRDIEQRMIVGPIERFALPGADRRFFAELLAALATSSAEIGRVRLTFWFATLQADGRMAWTNRGTLALSGAAARRLSPGGRTAQAVWPALEQDTVPPELWKE
jgi:hypothetical protein